MERGSEISEGRKKPVKTILADGTIIYVQAATLGSGSEQDVANRLPSFTQVTKALEGMAESLTSIWEKTKPTNASVEFGIEFVLDSGEVLAWFVDSSTTASMKITLEWNKPEAKKDS